MKRISLEPKPTRYVRILHGIAEAVETRPISAEAAFAIADWIDANTTLRRGKSRKEEIEAPID